MAQKFVTFYCREEEHDQMKSWAEKAGISFSRYIVETIYKSNGRKLNRKSKYEI